VATAAPESNVSSLADQAYAVVDDNGRQHRVVEGTEVLIDLRADAMPGDSVVFDKVLVCRGKDGVRVGSPTVEGARVTAEVVGQTSAKKIIVFKYRRRKDSRRKQGHRQKYTKVRIGQIEG